MRLFFLVIAFLFSTICLVRAADPPDLDLSLGGIYKSVDENEIPTELAAGQPSRGQVSDRIGRLGHGRYRQSASSSAQPPRVLISGGGDVEINNQPKTFVELFSTLENVDIENVMMMDQYHAIQLEQLPQGAYLGDLFLLPQDRFESIDILIYTQFESKYGITLTYPEPGKKKIARSDFFNGILAYPLGDPINGNTLTDYIYFTTTTPPILKVSGKPSRIFFWLFGKFTLGGSLEFSGLYLGDFAAPAEALHILNRLGGHDIDQYHTLSRGSAPTQLVYRQ